MEMQFCRRCGLPLKNLAEHIFKCNGNHIIYRNSSPAMAIILVNEEKEPLIAIRGIEPGKGKLHVPAGFCGDAETFEDAIERELAEELNLSPQNYSSPVYVLSHIDSYEYKNEVLPVITAVYWSSVASGVVYKPGDDLVAASFVPYGQLDLKKFQFESVTTALKKLHTLGAI